jgi:ribosome-binding protein aMBF1 (putative translation factor)
MASAANSFRLTAAEMFEAQQAQQLRTAGVLLKSYRDYSSATKASMTQKDLATAAKTDQSVISDLERGKKVPTDKVLKNILTAVNLPVSTKEGSALYENLRTIRDTSANIKLIRKHKP